VKETYKPLTLGLAAEMAKAKANRELRLSEKTRPCHGIVTFELPLMGALPLAEIANY